MKRLIPNESIKCSILSMLKERVPDIDIDFGAVKLTMQLATLSQQSLHLFEGHFAQWGLSQGRFTIMMLLLNMPDNEWTPVKLAEATGVTKATVTGLLKNLERDGHVLRQPHETDRRKTRLTLSDAGKTLMQSVIPAHFSQISSYYKHLTKKQMKQISESLELLQQTINSASNS
ncbi:MAG: MarR family winged helix-turn-helix transcriptional regulator [Chromatiales bacterium]|nr:MarR family winged helix-turn-helix transcriptional regulator [Chromatiales bacterium]